MDDILTQRAEAFIIVRFSFQQNSIINALTGRDPEKAKRR